ncbi:MAG: hypothetical protein JWP95_488, partial [Actinotalea sp.]|nr:hypothetical protein [Actinotalea sp.]
MSAPSTGSGVEAPIAPPPAAPVAPAPAIA